MKIAICEDNVVHREQLVECILTWAKKHQLRVQENINDEPEDASVALLRPLPTILQYGDANSFLFNLAEQSPYDLVFLDIDLGGDNELGPEAALTPGYNASLGGTAVLDNSDSAVTVVLANAGTNEDGLYIANQLREQDPNVVIVFVTQNARHVFNGYKVQAFDFLTKPVRQQEIERILDHVDKWLTDLVDQSFLADTSLGVKRIVLRNIYYFESQLQFVKLYGVRGEEVFRARLADIIDELEGRGFISPHRSYLVNMAHISCISKTTITMVNGATVPISRNRQKQIMAAWVRYFGGGIAMHRDAV